MLPILKIIEFSKILPLSEKSIEKVTFRDGINKFLADNGSGKTTFTDLIEHSLVRDAHAFAWNIFSKKRADKTAYVKADWIFGNEVDSIVHEFTDAGARTRVSSPKFSNKAHTRDMYSDFLQSKTNLNLEEVQKIFEAVYYKRENDLNLLGTPGEENLMTFFELLNKAIRMETPSTIKLRNQIGEIQRQIDLRKNSKRKFEVQLEKMEIIFAGTDSSAQTLDTIGNRKGELERDTQRLRNEIEKQSQAMLKAEEEDEKIIKNLETHQENLVNIRSKQDELKAKRFNLKANLEKLTIELDGFNKLGKINYNEIKKQWEKRQICELCGSTIYNRWEERLNQGCPVCGTEWKMIPKNVKDGLSKTQGKLDTQTRNIQNEIERISHELRTLDEDIAKLEKEEEKITDNLKSLREKLATNNSRRREIQRKNEEINEQIQRIGMEIGGLSAQEKMINQDESIALLKVNLEKINSELENYNNQLEKIEKELPEQKELQKILNNFTRTTKETFGYSMLADTDTRMFIITKDDSNRDFAAMSWSERYFIDVVFRIAIFHFLIESGIIAKGFLILDSPEAALDTHRLELLANLINNQKNKINFIVATRVKTFYEQLKGQPLEIKKQTQMSLFDFIS